MIGLNMVKDDAALESSPWIAIYFPWRLKTTRRSATEIRPFKMIQAFSDLGYSVVAIHGNHGQKSGRFSLFRKKIKKFGPPLFVYFESSTWPLLSIGNWSGRISRLWVDLRFLWYLRLRKIPVCIFVRDIHWVVPDLLRHLGTVARLRYVMNGHIDIWTYQKTTTVLAVPSFEMVRYISIFRKTKLLELPPGTDIVSRDCFITSRCDSKISLLYIGGIAGHYRMHILFEAIVRLPHVQLVVCCRSAEWEEVKKEYPIAENISIVHLAGDELQALYQQSNIGVIMMQDHPYWDFAMPLKLFDYMSWGMPILASKGTALARFVTSSNTGIAMDYDVESLVSFLDSDAAFRLVKLSEHVSRFAGTQTWMNRANTVASTLLKVRH
jgi:glycosyltransferase involved in cell wall biosynthesis